MTESKSYRILGIDPGTAIVGWGVLDVLPDNTLHVVAYGDITTDTHLSDEERLHEIHQDLTEIITTHKPRVAAIEQLFFFKNQKTIITVAQARGVIIHTCHAAGLPLSSYTPLQIKQSLTGYGRATKKQMQDMVTKTLTLRSTPQPDDTADALAVAICHNNSRHFKEQIAKNSEK